MLNTSLVPHDVRLCCADCGHREEQTLCGWKACSLTSDLLLSSQIAAELIQSSAVAAALQPVIIVVIINSHQALFYSTIPLLF